jgi:Rps23 Pro-64 3,4-dihydroxylase Tpa1-like proline 4-hydroxylase
MQSSQTAILTDEPPRLNPQLDCAALAQEYRRNGRIHIQNVLNQASAERVYLCLRDETRYELCLNAAGDVHTLSDLTPKQRLDCATAAWRKVGIAGFQFLFDMHLLSFSGEPYRDPKHYWAKATAFLNSSEFLGFSREITGFESIEYADAQATLYRSGHFLTAHDDNTAGAKRLAAYVLSFTPAWRPEWGGLLEFLDETGQVERGYVPGFNTLKLFRVPMTHYVSMVAPSAMAGRYSITGWLRAR